MKLGRILARIMLWSLPVLFYVFTYRYEPFINTVSCEMPEPTRLLRSAEVYDPSSFGSPVKAGFSKRDITPGRWTWLAGYHPPHPGIFINDRLWVKSLALRDESGEVAVIVSCDLIGLLPDEIKKIKSLVKSVDPNRVFISCTHTHSGPDTMGLWGWLVISGKNKSYMKFLREEIVTAIDSSVDDLKNASLRFGKGEFKGYNVGRYENPPDTQVAVMQVLLSSGRPITLVNYACHADVIKSLRITADFPYFLTERLKILTGGETMFVPRAIGGVQPSGSEHEEFPDFAKILGENLADKVVFEIMKNPTVPELMDISCQSLIVKSPLENPDFIRAAKLGVLSDLRGEDGLIAAEVSLIEIGQIKFLTVPGELFPKIWWHVEPLMKGEINFILGMTNGEFGYIMLPEDFGSGRHKYHASVSVGPTFGELIDRALHVILLMKN